MLTNAYRCVMLAILSLKLAPQVGTIEYRTTPEAVMNRKKKVAPRKPRTISVRKISAKELERIIGGIKVICNDDSSSTEGTMSCR